MAKYGKLEWNQRNIINASEEIFHRLDETHYREPEFAYKKIDQYYERFDIPEATTREGIINFIPRRWPGRGGQDAICNVILAYTRTAAALEEMVRRIVFKHYKIPEQSTGYIFRMMKYKEVNFGCSDHTNREFFAVLDLNQVDGLEMKYDGRWREIGVKPSTFLVMAGEPLKDWSEGKIHPLKHRVTMLGNRERYSVGLFSYYNEQAESSRAMVKQMSKLRIESSKSKAKDIPKEQVERSRRS
ncbi:hypothetical protein K2173_018958 [Erythroxylum novogranatense]|uniref:Isopenicillin N synthase-like Fe(2+) 2OG dioxygenase domain-containing protein n=1 Tax=Erythroxylum novogranatense TaxID=1862640 RepID=A0AAV8STA9_9ROSI|nr:hypothetical protein K2173_018958 [Erythroxylum novogranatense]